MDTTSNTTTPTNTNNAFADTTTDNFATIDIETIPASDIPEDCLPKFNEEDVKVGNLKDRFKIEEKINQERMKFEANIHKTMSLDPDLCRILCISTHETATNTTSHWYAQTERDEYTALYEAWQWITSQIAREIPVVTFNGQGFDFPVMIRRAMLLDVAVPARTISQVMKRQDSNRVHLDLMLILASRNPFSGRPEAKGLNYYLQRFQITNGNGVGKYGGMTGADVYPAFQEGRHQQIIDYCRSDSELTRDLCRRIYPWIMPTKAKNVL